MVPDRSRIGSFLDTLLFPLRAIFLDGFCGLSSLKDERMRKVRSYCQGRVLDIGCGPGNLFIQKYIGADRGIGIDVYPYDGVENIVEDMAHLPFEDESFDTVTLIAVGGHIPAQARVAEFHEFSRVLKRGGRLVMTEGEPLTQWLVHRWIYLFYSLRGKQDADTERGMKAGEEYCMPAAEIVTYLNTPPLKFVAQNNFMWGLNHLYIAEKYA